MENLIIQKIENKVTKTTASLSFETDKFDGKSKSDAFKRLLAISIINGGSGNTLRQVTKEKLSKNVNFDLIKELQAKADELIYKMVKEIERVEKLDGITTETKTFI